MTDKEFMALLRELRACSEAVKWAKGKSLSEVWEQCERGDWLLWLCGRMADKEGWPTRKEVVLAACACAEPALKYVKAGEDRPRIAIETARKWVRGEATLEEVRTAAYAAAYAAAAYAAYAYAAAAYAAYAAAAYAAYAAYARREESRLASLRQSADIVRATIKLSILAEGVHA
jgi:hypothetical protein